jgi:hypothetical protein
MTPQYDLSHHGAERLQQRGVKEAELPLLLSYGTSIDDHVVQLLDCDVDREIARLKREIEALERLRGCQAILDADTVVSVYYPSKRRSKRNLRRHRAGPH